MSRDTIDISPLVYPKHSPFIAPGVIPTPYISGGVLVVGVAINPTEGFNPPLVDFDVVRRMTPSGYTVGESNIGFFLNLVFDDLAAYISGVADKARELVDIGVITSDPPAPDAAPVFWARTTHASDLFTPMGSWELQKPSPQIHMAASHILRAGGVEMRHVRINRDGTLHIYRKPPVVVMLDKSTIDGGSIFSEGPLPTYESRLDPRPVAWYCTDRTAFLKAFHSPSEARSVDTAAIGLVLRFFGFYPDDIFRAASVPKGRTHHVWTDFYRFTTAQRITRSGEWKSVKRNAGVRLSTPTGNIYTRGGPTKHEPEMVLGGFAVKNI